MIFSCGLPSGLHVYCCPIEVVRLSSSITLLFFLQAQQMVMDTLGLALCVALTYGVRNSQKGRVMLPLVSFPFLAAVALFSIFFFLFPSPLSFTMISNLPIQGGGYFYMRNRNTVGLVW